VIAGVDRALVILVGAVALATIVLLGSGCVDGGDASTTDWAYVDCRGSIVCGPAAGGGLDCECSGVHVTTSDAGADGGK